MEAPLLAGATLLAPLHVNAADDVFDNAVLRPGHAAFARKVDGVWHTVTAHTFAGEVAELAAGLIASGVEPGDRVVLMSSTRYEWMLCDFAIWSAGAVTVPIYETSSVEQVGWILEDSGAVAAFVEHDRHAATVEAARSPAVRHVWRLDSGLDTLRAAGRSVPLAQVRHRRHATRAETLATLVYTSGTTGRPKGCVITHGNLAAEVHSIAAAEGVSDLVLTDTSSILLFLPLAHILARVVALAAIHNGVRVACTSDLPHLADELREYRPTVLLAVPRVFEKLHDTARCTAEADGHGRLFRLAEAVAIDYSRALEAGGPGRWLRAIHRVFDRLVYAKVRAALGGRVSYACSGGAPLGWRLGHFLRGAGITILEGWGLTETSAAVTLNLPAAQHIGSVGVPLPGCAVRLDTDGEVLVRGANVFHGYWRNDAATAEVFDDDGWFRTGDLGALDGQHLVITGRKKDLIVTASGKNVAPALLEDRLRAHWLIDQCLLVGDRRPYVGALLTLDLDGFARWRRQHHRPTATIDDPDLTALLRAAVDEVNQAVSAAEAIKRFRVVAGTFVVGEELTPTQKVRRDYVLAKLAGEVEALYEPAARPGQ
jgi:long-chain acyl-CoA synthetase